MIFWFTTIPLNLSLMTDLKGVFAKNERGYRFNAIKKRFWSLLILLLSVPFIRIKWLKTTHGEERSVLQIQKVVTLNLNRKIINLFPHKSFSNSHRLSFATFVYSWFFLICFNCYDLRVTYKNVYSCFEDFW